MQIYDEGCVQPPVQSPLSLDCESILVSNTEVQLLLIDPVVKIVSEQFDERLNDYEAGVETQDQVVYLF